MRLLLPLFLALSFLVSSGLQAQVTLGNSPFEENFNGMTTTPPNGFSVRTGATATSAGTAVAAVAKVSWATTVGQFTNYASATGLTAATAPADQANATNRALGVRQTGGFGDPGASFVFQVANTSGKTGFKLEFLLQSLDVASIRSTTWTVQYGIGASPTEFFAPSSVTGDLVTGGTTFENNAITVDFGGLLDNKSDIITIRIAALAATTGTNNRPSSAIDDFKLSWTAGASTSPNLVINNSTPTTLNFPSTAINKESQTQSYTLKGENLTAPVDISATGPFLVSTSATSGFAASVNVPSTELTTDKTIYVRYAPTVSETSAGTLTHTSNGATARTISLTGQSFDPQNLTFNFNACTAAGAPGNGFSVFSVAGAQNWSCSNFGNNGTKAVDINGFSGSAQTNDDWLISPPVSVGSIAIPFMSFYSRGEFNGPSLQLLISTNYTGTGNPNAATWTALPATFPPLNNTWTISDGIDLTAYKGAGQFYVAFRYTSSTPEGAARWTVDDVRIYDATYHLSANPTSVTFPETLPAGTSASTPFVFRGLGYGDLTVSASPNFQVSADNTSFSQSVTVPAATASAGQTLYTRFAPATKQLKIAGSIKAQGTGIDSTLISLSGSSYAKAETVDVGAYNLSFFGSNSTNNPTQAKIDTQINNIARVMQRLNLDIIGVEEVSSDAAMAQLMTKLPGYNFVLSNRWSYSFNPPDPTFPPQKIGFVYNSAVATLVSSRVMFESLYDSARANEQGVIRNYPSGNGSSFWASGRLPFMATFDVKIGNTVKRVRVIDIHAKAVDDIESYRRRAYDVKVLKDTLDAYYPNDNIIILGDFNDRLFGSITTGQTSPYQPFIADVAGYTGLTYPLDSAGRVSFITGSGLIDHIVISNEMRPFVIAGSTDIEDPRTYIPGYNATTASDHLPLFTRFDLSLAEAPLPVQLLNFTGAAAGSQISLSWSTAFEANASGFVVERSTDGRNFTTVATVAAKGNSSSVTRYQATDVAPLTPVNIYRLKQIDKDGSFTYSKLVTVNFATAGQKGMEIYPNPVTNKFNISLRAPGGKYAGIVTGSTGQLFVQERGSISDISQKINAKLDSLKPGVYTFQLRSATELHSVRFIKQ